MTGLVPAIYAIMERAALQLKRRNPSQYRAIGALLQRADARDKPGHDDVIKIGAYASIRIASRPRGRHRPKP
jgi:hypothetical protein